MFLKILLQLLDWQDISKESGQFFLNLVIKEENVRKPLKTNEVFLSTDAQHKLSRRFHTQP